MQSARTTASNFSFRVCIGKFCPILSSAAAILNFLAAILDFYRFVRYQSFKFEYILPLNMQKPCNQKELQPQIWDKGCSYVKILLFKGVLWHSGGHLGFQEMLKGESFTPSWILFCTIRRIIISWEKKYIRHFHLMTESCCPLPDYKARWSIAVHANLKNSTIWVSAPGILGNSFSGVSAHAVCQKPRSYKVQWSITVHGNLKISTTGVSAHGDPPQKLC